MTTLSESTGSQFTMSPLWRVPPDQRSLPYLIELLAVLAAISILLVFIQVVRSSVQQGDRLRLAMTVRSAATHHCNSLNGAGAAGICLQQLNAPGAADPAPKLVQVSAAAPLK